MRYKVAIRFVIEGDLRFISHHDTSRLFERALSRAEWPVRFSEGFNPRPKLSLPAPRPVGVASEAEILVVELTEPLEPAVLLDRLGAQVPDGLRPTGAWVIESKRPVQVDAVGYAVALPPEQQDAVAESLDRLRAAGQWQIDRKSIGKRPARTIDLKAYLLDASVSEGRLQWTARVTNRGSIRPAEVLEALGLEPEAWHHLVRRTSVALQEHDPAQANAVAPGSDPGSGGQPPPPQPASRVGTDVTKAGQYDRNERSDPPVAIPPTRRPATEENDSRQPHEQ